MTVPLLPTTATGDGSSIDSKKRCKCEHHLVVLFFRKTDVTMKAPEIIFTVDLTTFSDMGTAALHWLLRFSNRGSFNFYKTADLSELSRNCAIPTSYRKIPIFSVPGRIFSGGSHRRREQ